MRFLSRPLELIEAVENRSDVILPRLSAGELPSYAAWSSMRGLWSMQVPAFRRGVNLISGRTAQCPVVQYGRARPIPSQYEAAHVPWVTMQRTVKDLVLHGRAYWLTVVVGSTIVYKRLPAESIDEREDGTYGGPDGEDLRISDMNGDPQEGRVVVFEGYDEGALLAGTDPLATALALELAARNYAESPHPGEVLKNVSAHELKDEEIDAERAAWAKRRRDPDGAVAYLNAGYELVDAHGWSPTELALADQRNQSALQVARLLNLDPLWVGAAVSGSSLTYQNRVDARQDLVDLTLSDYMLPIEQRLSCRDTFGGTCRFDTSAFLRANLTERATVATQLKGADIVTAEEAKAFVSETPTGSIA